MIISDYVPSTGAKLFRSYVLGVLTGIVLAMLYIIFFEMGK